VNEVTVFVTVNPVTHTALTDVKRTSWYLIGTVLELGNISNPDPIRIIIRKLEEKIKAGGKFMELISPNILGISRIAMTKLVIITAPSLEKKFQKIDSLFTMPETGRKTKNAKTSTEILILSENLFSLPRRSKPTINLEKKSNIKTE
jgi:hypothetical protein